MKHEIRNPAVFALAAALALAGCQKPSAEPEPAVAPAAPASAAQPAPAAGPPTPASEAQPAAPANPATPEFVGKVWEVKTSSAVEPGTQYSFLADGTLVIASKNGPPGYGKWTYENGALTMIEEGISYPTDILKLDAGTFEIRSHNPGEPVTITLVPAAGAPLPSAHGG
ncbi:hypothetical protein FCE95_15615 [Luteimonas gilva]|uniref:Lipoprotein n=1 Tax=Luteimonas gilva TaxID=2572684 RepID=A0A4U5JT78_9GAMM|nr:hypothetical protein [Luteimonas gilva]TKR29559.1 hypothetical protein FCE95_15615 [Luteimonas gilva]